MRRSAPPERRDERIAGHVDEVKRHEAGPRALFRPMTDAADVMRAAQAHRAQAEPLRPRDARVHRLEGDDLAEALVAFHGQYRARVLHDLRVQIQTQLPIGKRSRIARNHADAVRIVPGQIRRHQMIGDEFGLARRAARALPDRPHIGMKLPGRDAGRAGWREVVIGHAKSGTS